jgi:hypothetical protein
MQMQITAPRVVDGWLEFGSFGLDGPLGIDEGSKKLGPPGTAHIMTSCAGLWLLTRLGHNTMARLYPFIRFEASRRDTSCIKSGD